MQKGLYISVEPFFIYGRWRGIRTPDPLVPNQMRYQAALFTEMFNWGVIPVNGCVYYGFSELTQPLLINFFKILVCLTKTTSTGHKLWAKTHQPKQTSNLSTTFDPDQCCIFNHSLPWVLSSHFVLDGGTMDFWLDLLFGNAVGLSSMIVIFGALGLMLFYGGFIIY